MVCAIPQVFGPGGLVLPAGNGAPALVGSFDGNSLTPLNTAIATQSVLLPLASPSSGIIYSWDPVSRSYASTTDSFGPVFGERAETVGKNRLFLGVSYQYLSFSKLDGTDLKHVPEVFTQPDVAVSDPPGTVCSANPDHLNATGVCAFIRDVVTVQNRIDLKAHQVTVFLTYGLNNRIDISAAIPIENIRLNINSKATIVNLSDSDIHAFNPNPGCTPSPDQNCLTDTFRNTSVASGFGDITLRAKVIAWSGERTAVAIGANVRLPTGDSLNFLGAGAAGVEPFMVWSRRARFGLHAGAGMQVNGSSKVAGDLTTGSTDRLPGRLAYSAGTDVWLTRRFTVAADFLGQTLFQTQRLTPFTFHELGACTVPYMGPPFTCGISSNTIAPPNTDPDVTQSTGNANILSGSFGAKVKLAGSLLFTGNVVVKIRDGGLRSNVIPMGELSYTF
jgi:lipopolysaccharide export system protein LptA